MINGSDAIDNVKDKLYSQQILGQSSLPVPKTMLVKHPINVGLVEKNVKYPMIVKTLSGSHMVVESLWLKIENNSDN